MYTYTVVHKVQSNTTRLKKKLERLRNYIISNKIVSQKLYTSFLLLLYRLLHISIAKEYGNLPVWYNLLPMTFSLNLIGICIKLLKSISLLKNPPRHISTKSQASSCKCISLLN